MTRDTSVPEAATSEPSGMVRVVTGIVYALAGLALAGGGAWLAALGGSLFYVLAGVGICASGLLLLAKRLEALWLYAVVMIATMVWAVSESGFDFWPLAARGDLIYTLGLWLLLPWPRRGLRGRGRAIAAPLLWGGAAIGGIVLAVGLSVTPNDISGTIDTGPDAGPVAQDKADMPDADWREYGRTQFGNRYSPLAQITPANVSKLKVAWTFRTGDLPGSNDPMETTFEVTPIKVRDTLYLCSQHQRLFAVDAKTGELRWSYDPHVQDDPTFQHLTCRGVSYAETEAGALDTQGQAAPEVAIAHGDPGSRVGTLAQGDGEGEGGLRSRAPALRAGSPGSASASTARRRSDRPHQSGHPTC